MRKVVFFWNVWIKSGGQYYQVFQNVYEDLDMEVEVVSLACCEIVIHSLKQTNKKHQKPFNSHINILL